MHSTHGAGIDVQLCVNSVELTLDFAGQAPTQASTKSFTFWSRPHACSCLVSYSGCKPNTMVMALTKPEASCFKPLHLLMAIGAHAHAHLIVIVVSMMRVL